MENNYLIETRGLTRRFGSQRAVDDLNLLVPAAGVYGFLGPNGAGKTTAIRMLLGLIRPNAGDRLGCWDWWNVLRALRGECSTRQVLSVAKVLLESARAECV